MGSAPALRPLAIARLADGYAIFTAQWYRPVDSTTWSNVAFERLKFLSERKGVISKVSTVLGGTGRLILGVCTLVGTGIALLHFLSPGGHTVTASFHEAKVEPQIGLEEYEDESHPPSSLEAAYDGSRTRAAGRYRLLGYTAFAPARPAGGLLVTVANAEEAELVNGEKTKEEGEKIKEEAKHEEEVELQEEAKIKEEAKLAEAREREEAQKEKEDAKLAEKTEQQGAAKAKAAEEKAAEEAARAGGTVQAKKEEERQTPAKKRIEAGASSDAVEAVLSKSGLSVSSSCGTSCGLRPTVEKAIASTPNLTQAAKEVAAAVGDSNGAEGARVDYAVALDGLAHKVLFLTWTLCSKHTGALSKEYWRDVTFRKYEPSSETGELVSTFWVPLPSTQGDYYFRLRVFDGSSEVAHTSTEPFG